MTEETLRQQYLEQKKKLQWETDLELHSKFLDRKVLLHWGVSPASVDARWVEYENLLFAY